MEIVYGLENFAANVSYKGLKRYNLEIEDDERQKEYVYILYQMVETNTMKKKQTVKYALKYQKIDLINLINC